MNENKFYFGGFYCLLGIILGFIINIFTYREQCNHSNIETDTIKIDTCLTPKQVSLEELNDSNLLKELHKQGIKHPKIVLAQAKLETGNYKSKICNSHNNLFGLKKKDGSYYKFNHWYSSVIAYRDYVQYKYNNQDNYYKFLKDIGYAEDEAYIKKVKEIVNQI